MLVCMLFQVGGIQAAAADLDETDPELAKLYENSIQKRTKKLQVRAECVCVVCESQCMSMDINFYTLPPPHPLSPRTHT
jgi:hypothetical protein